MADYHLELYTQEKKVFDGDVTSVIAPGGLGYLGVLAHHAPLLTTLTRGTLTIRKGSEITQFHLAGGFLEVHGNQATILADGLKPL